MSTLAIWIWTVVWFLLGAMGGSATMMSPMMFDAPSSRPTAARFWTLFLGMALWPITAWGGMVVVWLCHTGVIAWDGYPVLVYIPFGAMALAIGIAVVIMRGAKND